MVIHEELLEASNRLHQISRAVEALGQSSLLLPVAELLESIAGFSYPMPNHTPQQIRRVENVATALSKAIIDKSVIE